MLATFSLRLACGLIACLLLLSPRQVNPRYFRTQFLVSLSLTMLAALVWGPHMGTTGAWIALSAALIGSLLGALSWSLQGAPGGRMIVLLTAAALLAAVVQGPEIAATFADEEVRPAAAWRFANDVSSAAVLGTALAAMLLGHFYLIAPGMSLTPLMRLLTMFFAAVLARVLVASTALFFWTRENPLANLDMTVALYLAVRWSVGFVGPIVLGWMARESAKIRSTQSATGILYVVVIFCFLGELAGLVLCRVTGLLF
jgi:hypothetical protein